VIDKFNENDSHYGFYLGFLQAHMPASRSKAEGMCSWHVAESTTIPGTRVYHALAMSTFE
jgi:hypothetical protein